MIFTLIEVKDGGAVNSRDWGSGSVESNLSISSWDEKDYDYWVNVIGRKAFEDSIGTYVFDRFTILINGVHVNETASDDLDDYYSFPTPNGEILPEEISHNLYAEQFWKDVLVAKNKRLVEHNQKVADKKAQEPNLNVYLFLNKKKQID